MEEFALNLWGLSYHWVASVGVELQKPWLVLDGVELKWNPH